jgi:glycogen synthase
MAAAHVLVQPSLLFENYPLSLIEALSVGTNVLVADYGGMREMVVDSGVGYLFQPTDPASLRTAWTRIRDAFTAGTLNSFDVAPFLAQRDEQTYRDTLLRLYEGASA